MILRPYQQQLVDAINTAWLSHRNVAAVSATGSGKTVLYSHVVAQEPGASVVIAHRTELVGQTSLALVRNNVRHRIIGSDHVRRWCQRQSLAERGHNYVHQDARVAVASVQTLVRREANSEWYRNVRLWVCDECHHLQAENAWGTAAAMFPNARGLGVTATLERADGRGLGRPDGLLETIVAGPSMRWLIDNGYLVDFKVFAPPSDIDLTLVGTAAGGDYSPEPLRKAVHGSHIVGDVVQHYLRLTPGQLGLTFCVDIEAATETAQAFRQAGVPAEVVTGKTPADIRSHLMRRFAAGEYRQLCVVDIVSEGTDIPAIDVVSLARPSQSYTLVAQQIGRALRTKDGKTVATVIDHVGNVRRFARVARHEGRHTIELDRETWTLDRRERRSRGASDAISIRTCPECLADYPSVDGRVCPYCGHATEPAGRSAPEMVEGDLAELSPEVLARLQGEIARIDGPVQHYPVNASIMVRRAIDKNHRERQTAQADLRAAMALWGGARVAEGLDLATAQRLFWHTFGVDVATAQTLGRTEAEALRLTLSK